MSVSLNSFFFLRGMCWWRWGFLEEEEETCSLQDFSQSRENENCWN